MLANKCVPALHPSNHKPLSPMFKRDLRSACHSGRNRKTKTANPKSEAGAGLGQRTASMQRDDHAFLVLFEALGCPTPRKFRCRV